MRNGAKIALGCVGCAGIGLLLLAVPFLYIRASYNAPPTIRDGTSDGEFVLFTPRAGPDAGRVVYGLIGPLSGEVDLATDPDFVSGARRGSRRVRARTLRPLTPSEFRYRFGSRYQSVADEVRGQGSWGYDFRVDGDVIATELDYDRDKYRIVTQSRYRVVGGQVRFLSRRTLDHSWPDLRDR